MMTPPPSPQEVTRLLCDWRGGDSTALKKLKNRAHFFAVAAQLMRRIMVDHARQRQALKRGGGAIRVTLDEAAAVTQTRADELLRSMKHWRNWPRSIPGKFKSWRCDTSEVSRNKVELLLKYHDQAGDFIASSAFEIALEFLLDESQR